MKKYIVTLSIALASLMGQAYAAGQQPLKNGVDSLAFYLGKTQGQALSMKAPSADYRQQFLRGMSAVLLSDTTQIGYLDGVNVGLTMLRELVGMNREGVSVNRQMFYDTFASAYTGVRPDSAALEADFAVLRSLLEPMQKRVQQQRQARQQQSQQQMEQLAERNLALGKEYIADVMKADKSIKMTESGLAYKVVKKGKGARPSDSDKVKVIYAGRLIDGTEFDSSKGKPVEFNVNGLIKGFTEGLKLMNKGAKYTLYIPADLAYGMQAPAVIGPNATLVFDVELVEIGGGSK